MSRRAAMIGAALAVGMAMGVAVAMFWSAGGGVNAAALPWVIVALAGSVTLVLGAVVWAAAAQLGAGRRTVARELDAQRLGFEYRGAGDKEFRSRYADLSEVPRGARIKHIHEGSIAGRPAVVFESSYVVSTGQTTVQVSNTIYAVEAPAWPKTQITPRNWFARLARKLGVRTGLELDDPEFNRWFKVTTDDENFAIALLSPDMQAFLLTKPTVKWRVAPASTVLRGAGRLCLIYSGTFKGDRMEASLQRMRRFWELVPAELESW